MKKILKYTMLLSFSLLSANYVWRNLVFSQDVTSLIKVALVLTIFELILKPILKFLLLPINILTLGTIRIFINALGLYLAVFLLDDFLVNPIDHPRLHLQGFPSFLLTSFTISLIFFIFSKLSRK